jgi:predicted lactoylglutathione lyase
MIPARVSIITLGVTDLERSSRFYEGWGWTRSSASQPTITFFQLTNVILGLYDHTALADDARLPAGPRSAFGGITLAINVGSPAEVDDVVSHALGAGGSLLRHPEKAEWGGYTGYVADPDGHPWEISHNPFFPIGADGITRLPDA